MKILRRIGIVYTLILFGCSTPPMARTPAATRTNMDKMAAAGDSQVSDQQITEACNKAGWTPVATDAQQKIIDAIFAAHNHRVQHSMWHAVRSGLSEAEMDQVLKYYGSGWDETHPLCPPPENNPDAPIVGTSKAAETYNPVGEDFLYMHHHMVRALRQQFLANHLGCIAPYTHIPNPTDPADAPPGVIKGPKTPQAYDMLVTWDNWIQNNDNLSKISLSQLGWALEFTIHNNLHMRFAEDRPPEGFRAANAKADGAQVPMDGKFPADWVYDDPAYNWLADPYGAAVNPRFWKIHGYVDHILDLWMSANKITRLAEDCGDDKSCYKWRGNWVGDPALMAGHHAMSMGRAVASTKKKPGSAQDSDFNRRRLAHQRLGVIGDIPVAAGQRAGPPPPVDLLEVARTTVCP